MPDTQVQPQVTSDQYTYKEFADKIRAKYPDSKVYKTKPDQELVDTWIKAKPERQVYKNKIKDTSFKDTGPGPGAVKDSMQSGAKKVAQSTTRQILKQAPNAGGIGGSILGGGKGPGAIAGAALGGATGEAVKQIGMRLLFDEGPMTSKDAAYKIVKQAGEQAAFATTGEAFVGILNKLPRATEATVGIGKKMLKIPLLPGDVNGGIGKYVEQFLTSYLPSSGVMKDFIEKQGKAIEGAAGALGNAMSKFKGTPEQFGKLLQDSTFKAKEASLTRTEVSLVKSGKYTAKQISTILDGFDEQFQKGLYGKILQSHNVEALSGLLINKGTGHQQIRELATLLSKGDLHETFKAARTAIMGDVFKKSLTGNNDPAITRTEQFAGKKFTETLNDIDRDRLKAIFTPTEYSSIMKFEATIKNVGGPSGFVGKFANLVFVLGPLRGMASAAGFSKLAAQSILTRTMAKIITTEAGNQAVENYARATGANLPRAVKMATDAMRVHVEQAHKEAELERKQADEHYMNAPK